jgi:protein-disulfide isomerase
MEINPSSPPSPPNAEDPQLSVNSQFSVWQFTGLLVLAFLIGIGAGFLIWGYPLQKKLAEAQQVNQSAQATITAGSAAAAAAQNEAPSSATAVPQVKRYDVPIDNNPTLGPESAPITLIEFSDYECPFCKKWNTEVYPKLKEKYGDQIRFVFRDFPLYSIHPDAIPSAEAANCAGEQNKYFEFHDLLFTGGLPLSRETFLTYANQIELDQASFEKCVDERRYQKEVESDLQFASNLGIQSTPTFFINGLAIVGAQPLDVFERVIDMELAGEIPQ